MRPPELLSVKDSVRGASLFAILFYSLNLPLNDMFHMQIRIIPKYT